MWKAFRYTVVMLLALGARGAFGGHAVRGAAPQITARLTPDSISIGDHVTLDVTVTKDIMQDVEFPIFKDRKLGDAIEILQEFDTDTVGRDGRQVTLSKQYLLTAFDAGHYALGGFPVLYMDKNIVDTLFSREMLSLIVTTFAVDTVQSTIYDIKRPEPAPRFVSEVSGYFITGIVALSTLAAMVLLIVNAMKRRMGRTQAENPKPDQPPHVKAIQELEVLHNQKVWQNNRHKLYYSRLADILRTYIGGRYGVGAMEMTTDEAMAAMERELTEKHWVDLRGILHTADMVKFAKLIPDGDRNESLYYKAYYFVEDTKDVPEEEPEKNGRTPKQENENE